MENVPLILRIANIYFIRLNLISSGLYLFMYKLRSLHFQLTIVKARS